MVSIPSGQGKYTRILRGTSLDDKLMELHGTDNINTVKISIIAWSSLLSDSPIDIKPNRVINKFINDLIDNYKGVVYRFADLADRVSRLVKHDLLRQGFIIKAFIKEFKDTPIFREFLEFYNKQDPQVLRYILSFLQFGKKIAYIDDSLDAEALRLWYQVEDRLNNATLPSYVSDLKNVLSWMFSNWEEDSFLPKHGSGAVAERSVWGAIGKNKIMSLDPKLEYLYFRGVSNMDHDDKLCLSTPTGNHLLIKDVRRAAARLKFVPKDLKKTRSICMEPVDFQWAQQGVRLWYEDWLKHYPLARHVRLEDQSFNQWGCWCGSVSSELATIDLSSASDSVSLDLVKSIFPVSVLKHLLGTRSRYVKVPDKDEPIEVKKFAPMGSALCFPVQCTVFSAVIILVSIAQMYGRDIWGGDSLAGIDIDAAYRSIYVNKSRGKSLHNFFVYGDDIIVDKTIISNVIHTLACLSFEVNVEKSYIDNTAYRESCGKHYFNGYDVSPYTFKVKQVTSRITLDCLVGVIDACNRALEYGYKNLYSCLVNFALRYPIEGINTNDLNPILFVEPDSEESTAIRCRYPRNRHLKERDFDPKDNEIYSTEVSLRRKFTHLLYTRDEVKSISVRPSETRRSKGTKYDPYYHSLWWRMQYRTKGDGLDNRPSSKADTKGVRAVWRWTAI